MLEVGEHVDDPAACENLCVGLHVLMEVDGVWYAHVRVFRNGRGWGRYACVCFEACGGCAQVFVLCLLCSRSLRVR